MNRKIKVESPGRINLIGEHVDYNGGSVLPGAIDKKVEFLIENIEGNKCIIESKTINKKFEFEFSNLKKSNEHWQNYIIGTFRMRQMSIGYTFPSSILDGTFIQSDVGWA